MYTVGHYTPSIPIPPDRQWMAHEKGWGHVCKGLCQQIFPSYWSSSALLRVICRPQSFEGLPAPVRVAHGLHHRPSGMSLLFCHGQSPSKTAPPAVPLWVFSAARLLPPAAAAWAEVLCVPLTGCSFGVWGELCVCNWFLLAHGASWPPLTGHHRSTLLIKLSHLHPVQWYTSNPLLNQYLSEINCVVRSVVSFPPLLLQKAQLLQRLAA